MPIIFNKYYPLRKIIFFLGEGALIFFSLLIVDWLFLGGSLFWFDLGSNSVRALLVTIIFQLCLYFFDQYDLSNEISIAKTFTRMMQAFGMGCMILGGVYYTVPFMIIDNKIFWFGYLVICLSVFSWRCAYYLILHRRLFAQNVIIVGTGTLASDIAKEIEGVKDSVYRIKGFVGTDEPVYNPYRVPVYSELEAFDELLSNHKIERVIVALDDARGVTPIASLLKYKLRRIPIEQGLTFYERVAGKILVEKVSPAWIIFSKGFTLNRWTYQLKRLVDLIFALLLLLLSTPILICTALFIKIESEGAIFYMQERVGERNVIFKIIKFRSMTVDAEKDGAVWAQQNDSRVTKVGVVIRRLRIDEIPQLWNVIKGDMSLVGPRPERLVFVNELAKTIPFYAIRHEVKPGVTGWAQVNYPYGASEVDALKKLEYDLYYMKNLSIAFDFLVIFKTIKTVLFRKGSR